MPEPAFLMLKAARIRSGKLQYVIANECIVSERTIQRWESGELQPGPDDIDRYAQSVGDPLLWHRWMLAYYESYRRRYIDSPHISGLPAALMHLRHMMEDVSAMQDDVERDGVDGVIDDVKLRERYGAKTKDMQAAISKVTDLMGNPKGGIEHE